LDIATKNRNFKAAVRPNLAARAPINQRRRAQAPSSRPGRQRRRSRSRSWSRSRSRSPIAAKHIQKDEEPILVSPSATNVSKQDQQTEGRESDQQDEHVLTPTEKRIRETAKEEAEKQQNIEKVSPQSPSGHNAVVDNLLRYETGLIKWGLVIYFLPGRGRWLKNQCSAFYMSYRRKEGIRRTNYYPKSLCT